MAISLLGLVTTVGGIFIYYKMGSSRFLSLGLFVLLSALALSTWAPLGYGHFEPSRDIFLSVVFSLMTGAFFGLAVLEFRSYKRSIRARK